MQRAALCPWAGSSVAEAPAATPSSAAPAKRARRHPARPIVLVVLAALAAFLIWRSTHRREGYAGGNVVTTGTVEATHVRLGFKVPGRIASVPVEEGDRVKQGDVVATLEPEDFDVQANAALAA